VWTPSGFLYPWGAAVPDTPPLPARGLQRQQRQLHASREVHPVPVRRLSQLDKLQALFLLRVKQIRGVQKDIYNSLPD
jgi:hypothetical protein